MMAHLKLKERKMNVVVTINYQVRNLSFLLTSVAYLVCSEPFKTSCNRLSQTEFPEEAEQTTQDDSNQSSANNCPRENVTRDCSSRGCKAMAHTLTVR